VTVVVLLILAVIWAAVLLPPWFQNRRENRPSDSIASFRQQLSVLQRTTPGQEAPHAAAPRRRSPLPAGSAVTSLHARRAAAAHAEIAARHAAMRRAEARKRRRDVLVTLFSAAATTLGMALLLDGPVWVLHLAVDALLLGYIALLLQQQQRTAERESKVRYLPRGARPEPALLLRRSGS
jgi:hypothetical protein